MVTSYIAVCAFIQDACLRRQWQLLYKVSSPSVAMEEGQIAASIFINEQGTVRSDGMNFNSFGVGSELT